jgi:hypothetical protein
MVGSSDNTRLFARCDTFKGTAVGVVFAESDLDDNQAVLIGHDQIKFAVFTAVILANQCESVVEQELVSLPFGSLTTHKVVGLIARFSGHR